jgi:hypothetical protein
LNSDFQVRVNREQTVHADWVVLKENGTGKLTLPKGATLLSVQGTYNSSTDIYVNCDSVSEKDNPVLHWYEVAEILTAGVVAPNGCVKPAVAAKLKSFANPGEFVFFVRKLNWREQMKEDYSSH